MLRLVGVTPHHQVPGTGELEQKLLEPQLVGLMNDDEEKLVVRGRVAEKLLESQQLGHLQVAPVRELAVLLTESGRARLGLGHVCWLPHAVRRRGGAEMTSRASWTRSRHPPRS